MTLLVALAVIGLIVNRGVDLIRTAVDVHDHIPKTYWLLAAWGIGVGVAYALCNAPVALMFLKVKPGPGCVDLILTGAGFGAVAGFWHEVLSALSARATHPAAPKGLIARRLAPPEARP